MNPETQEKIEAFRRGMVIANRSEKTIKNYLMYINDFFEKFPRGYRDVGREDIEVYLVELKEKRGYEPASLALVFSALRAFFDGFLTIGLTTGMKAPKVGRKLPVVLTQEEVRALVKGAKDVRDRAIIQTLYCGLRVSEVAGLERNDLDFSGMKLQVRHGKGDKARVVRMSKQLAELVRKYLGKRGDTLPYLFVTRDGKRQLGVRAIQRMVKNTAARAGIQKPVSCHKLRHSFATHLLESGVDIRYIQALLGHADLSTTQIYTQVSDRKLDEIRLPGDEL